MSFHQGSTLVSIYKSAKPNFVGSRQTNRTNTPAGLCNANCDGTRQNAPRPLARSAKGRKVNGQIKTRRGWYSESWGQLCLSLSSLSNASSTTGPAPLDHLNCRIAKNRLSTCSNAAKRADRVGWQQPACVTNLTLSSSVPTFRRNLLLPSSGLKCAHIHPKFYAHLHTVEY